MIKKNIKELNLILSALEKSFDYDEDYGINEDYFIDILSSFRYNYIGTQNFSYEFGASKGVIIFPNLNFVIKIPFKSFYGECGIKRFINADNKKNNWDYCLTELEIYNKAKENNIENCFAEIELLTVIKDCDNYPIYIQQFADIYKHNMIENSFHTIEDKEKIDEYQKKLLINCSEEWLSDLLHIVGEKVYEKFQKFLYNNYKISDLHSRNIGYINKIPVLIDFSGYRD